MRRANLSYPQLPSVPAQFSEASAHTRAAQAAAALPAPALLAPAAPPGNRPACQRRGFGKEAASNHSCGWDVVSILSPSFLPPPQVISNIYPNQSRSTAAARAAAAAVDAPARRGCTLPSRPHRRLTGCQEPLTTPAFNGQSEFSYDLSAARTTGLKPPDSRASFQNDSEPAQLPPSLQRQRCSISSRVSIPAARRLLSPPEHLPGVPSTPGRDAGRCSSYFWHHPAGPRVLRWGEPTRSGATGDSPLHDDEQTLPPLVEVLVDIHDADDVRALRCPPVQLHFPAGLRTVLQHLREKPDPVSPEHPRGSRAAGTAATRRRRRAKAERGCSLRAWVLSAGSTQARSVQCLHPHLVGRARSRPSSEAFTLPRLVKACPGCLPPPCPLRCPPAAQPACATSSKTSYRIHKQASAHRYQHHCTPGGHRASLLSPSQPPGSTRCPPVTSHHPSAPWDWRDPPALCPDAQPGHKGTLPVAWEATSTQPRVPGEGTKQTARCSLNNSFSHKQQQLFNEALALPRDNSQFPGAGRICSSATDY